MKNLIIIGGGNAALEIIGIIQDINRNSPTYSVLGILDDDVSLQKKVIGGVCVLGTLSAAQSFSNAKFIFGIGSIKTQHIRSKILERLKLKFEDFETLIHPTAVIDESSNIANGCIIHPRATIGNDVQIGNFVTIAVGSTLGSFVKIGNFSMITSHVLILSNSRVEESVFIASMTCVIENLNIGSNARIGVGSVVGKDVKAGIFAMGNPIRFLGNSI
jgi:acetyltransferase EpsM